MGVNPWAVTHINSASEVLWVFCRDRGHKKTKCFRKVPAHPAGEVWWPVLASHTPGRAGDTAPWAVGFQLGVRLHFLGGSPQQTAVSWFCRVGENFPQQSKAVAGRQC